MKTKLVLKNNKTTKSLKVSIGNSNYTIIMNKKIVRPIDNCHCKLNFSSYGIYTESQFLYTGWERLAALVIPRDLVHDMLEFIHNNDDDLSHDNIDILDSHKKYSNTYYELYSQTVRWCSDSKMLYIGRGGTISDSSFCIDTQTSTIERIGDCDLNSLENTSVPFFEYVRPNMSKDEIDCIEIQNFECSLLPNYEIYKELRDFIEFVKTQNSQSYAWPFKTFKPYGDI